ncbi:hypothetical protein IMG5_062790 [Ichthyophthirius multifiliis]|uniref:Uncharacterized protein n=1 Tax=Ichthyophthirius multifiliis TaxID=5932 RepID=G0QNZ6_ICHMU|nr:hypothetical protein IMG5_062790 [Ichthyophthirius multifiliis]EGR33054.1 hypothetical protein IMG5_062790 [Ichthyophthirius multifiliis]|eukprot:XP_004037040.1 hypothetical protein IMG5_062790 [Ichthyophthirius multifiliis]
MQKIIINNREIMRSKQFIILIKIKKNYNKKILQIQTLCREYRKQFSKAYKILFKDNELCYLTEILDSAQEGFPYLWVNGDKYIFSNEVLNAGQQLLDYFFQLQYIMRSTYSKICQESCTFSIQQIKDQIINSIEKFDQIWVKFEKSYVLELMHIENDARRYIQKAIEIEQELESIEIREKIKGKKFIFNQDIHNLYKKLCNIINQLNSVANIEGKGRDDLQFEVLQESECILRKITKEQSQAVRQLAENIKNSFQKLRKLFLKYQQNMEMVDPQLKNNIDLVEALFEYEQSWEKGQSYFLDPKKLSYLVHFSHIIETTAQKYKHFSEQVECRDADIFLNIPCLMILKCLNNEDKNICAFFLPQLFQNDGNKVFLMLEELKKEFNEWKAGHTRLYEFHNILEKNLLGIQLSVQDQFAIEFCKQQIENMIHKIKQLAMELQRKNPSEWNSFLDAALCESLN